jgi:ABC-2 type transport system permease protein
VVDGALLYVRLVRAQMRAQLQYRVSFVLQLLGAFALSFVDFLTVLVIFQHLPYLAGWSLGEVAFLYGTSYIAFQITDMAVGTLDGLPQQIQRGDFDMVLIRPRGSLLQVLTSDFALRRLGALGQGALVLGLALARVQIDWTAGRVLVLLLMPVCGCGIFAGVWIIGATSSFWLVRSMEIVNSVTYGGQLLTSYPMHIYGLWLRRFFTILVPLAFVNYFPALYVLGKPDPLGAPGWVRFLAPAVSIAMLLLARRAWGFGVRHYRSTGS